MTRKEPITANDYQCKARVTATYPEAVKDIVADRKLHQTEKLLRLSYLMTGLTGEVGELQGTFSKVIRDSGGKIYESDLLNMKRELGDICWFVAELATEFNIPLGEILSQNLDKLRDRLERNVISGSGDDR